MIDSILLIDDEELFHLVFEDACSLLEISLSLQALYSSDEGEKMVKAWNDNPSLKPDCIFVDMNIVGSSFNGIELVRKVNTLYGNNVVIGMISSSSDQNEIEEAKKAGAMLWIVKTDEIEPRLEQFHSDFQSFKDGSLQFRVYK